MGIVFVLSIILNGILGFNALTLGQKQGHKATKAYTKAYSVPYCPENFKTIKSEHTHYTAENIRYFINNEALQRNEHLNALYMLKDNTWCQDHERVAMDEYSYVVVDDGNDYSVTLIEYDGDMILSDSYQLTGLY